MFAAQNVVTGSVRLVKLEAPWPMLVCHCAEFYTICIYIRQYIWYCVH